MTELITKILKEHLGPNFALRKFDFNLPGLK